MKNIGFTTGCLYKSKVSFESIISIYRELGVNAIELSFASPSELERISLGKSSLELIKEFDEVSIHAPWREIEYKRDENSKRVIEKLKQVKEQTNASGIVVHPDTVFDFDYLQASHLPFLIENMDGRKKYGTHPEHFRKFKENYDFGFVLDVQHAYKQDPRMGLAKELISAMDDRLKHMHVSGHSGTDSHAPVHTAENREEITKILEMKLDVPKICEGLLLENIGVTALNEMEYIRKY